MGGSRGRVGAGGAYGLLGVPGEAAVDVEGEGAGQVERRHAQPRRQRLERRVHHRHLRRLLFHAAGDAVAQKPSSPDSVGLRACHEGRNLELAYLVRAVGCGLLGS